ncbi:hypothetical protein MTR67_013452 [Solanum verrucosum]|uniref:Response regulatory domain-containing protein n=1 Tax=Solanum verrucosum TaxID=315347 RepID=A0AAF0QAJ7_SOLVR|nr:hypothetical protein MTR67_013452 [Solanum verrucosum]
MESQVAAYKSLLGALGKISNFYRDSIDSAQKSLVITLKYSRPMLPQQTLPSVSLASINGQEAVLAHHNGACFDLIMMDLDMSVMNACQELRDMHVDSLIVGMTSCEKEEEEKSFLNAGLDYYYQKPLTIDVVCNLVEKINGNG